MAQLAAQDYFSRLQASGLSAFPHPADLAAAFPGGLPGLGTTANNAGSSSSTNSRQNNGDSKTKGRKEKKSSNSNNNSGHNNSSLNNSSNSALNLNAGTSSSPSSYKVCQNVLPFFEPLFNEKLIEISDKIAQSFLT